MKHNQKLYQLLLILALIFAPKILAHPDENAKKVAILMFDGVQTIDFAAPFEVFNTASFEVFTVSHNGQSVSSAMGLSVNPKYSFESMPDADIVIIPGGSIGSAMENDSINQWIVQTEKQAESILSICNGAFILAQTGLLDGSQATTFHRAFNSFEQNYPNVELIRDQRYVDNGKVVTSAGLASGIDSSLHIVAKHKGLDKARAVALHLEYDWQPNQGFVRGKLADQHYPNWDHELFEGLNFNKLTGLGDEYQWRNVFHVSGAESEESLADLFNKQLSSAKSWNKNPLGEWMKISAGQPWKITYNITPLPDSNYEVSLMLNRI